jgi:hypothetical protein
MYSNNFVFGVVPTKESASASEVWSKCDAMRLIESFCMVKGGSLPAKKYLT